MLAGKLIWLADRAVEGDALPAKYLVNFYFCVSAGWLGRPPRNDVGCFVSNRLSCCTAAWLRDGPCDWLAGSAVYLMKELINIYIYMFFLTFMFVFLVGRLNIRSSNNLDVEWQVCAAGWVSNYFYFYCSVNLLFTTKCCGILLFLIGLELAYVMKFWHVSWWRGTA